MVAEGCRDVSFLRKQESRLLCACCRVPALCLLPCSCTVPAAVFLDRKQGPGTMDSFSILDSRLRGNDTPGERVPPVFPSSSLSQWGRGEDDK